MWWLLVLMGCPWVGEGALDEVMDADGDGAVAIAFGGRDCDDSDPTIFPGAADEPRDGVDSDCDGANDYDADRDGVPSVEDGDDDTPIDCDDDDPTIGEASQPAFSDGDGDGYGVGESRLVCELALGEAAVGGDCDDASPSVFPGAPDTPYDGIDSDCGGIDPLGCGDPAYDIDFDVDGDCLVASSSGGDDCDDSDAAVGLPGLWFVDGDGDGFGAIGAEEATLCAADAFDYAREATDCDDGNARVNPAAQEICDVLDVDEDCDGLADDADPDAVGQSIERWPDHDGDGWGAEVAPTVFCDAPPPPDATEGYVWADNGDDCYDQVGDPGAPTPSGGGDFEPADVNPATEWFVDRDQDLFGDPELASGTIGCDAVPQHAPNDADCNDDDPLVHPGAVDEPMNLDTDDLFEIAVRDEDCGGDSEADLDGDGYAEPLAASVDDLLSCTETTQIWRVGPTDPLQAVIDAAEDCDRIELVAGTYDAIVIERPLVLAAVPGDEVVFLATPATPVGITVNASNVVLSGLTVRGFDVGVLTVGEVLLENGHIDDGLLAVQSYGPTVLFDMLVTTHTFGLDVVPGGQVYISESTFEGLQSPSYGLGVLAPDEAGLTFASLFVFDSTFRESSAPLGMIGGPLDYLVVRDSDFVGNTGPQLSVTDLLTLVLRNVDMVDNLSVSWFMALATGRDENSIAYVTDTRVRDSLWGYDGLPHFGAFVAIDEFGTSVIRRVSVSGNRLLFSDTDAPWLRSIDYYDFFISVAPRRVVSNLLVSASGGTGVLLKEAELRNATIVGTDHALWPVTDFSGFSQEPTSVIASILWGNEQQTLPDDPALLLLAPGELELSDTVVEPSEPCPVGPCLYTDPEFLRYDPHLAPALWDLQLSPSSPHLSEATLDPWPCTTGFSGTEEVVMDAVIDQRGAFGSRGLPIGAELGIGADPVAYNSCWPKALVDPPVIYDRWQREYVVDLPEADPDADGLDNLSEFEGGTVPTVSDTDGDGADDANDPAPLDSCVPDPYALACLVLEP